MRSEIVSALVEIEDRAIRNTVNAAIFAIASVMVKHNIQSFTFGSSVVHDTLKTHHVIQTFNAETSEWLVRVVKREEGRSAMARRKEAEGVVEIISDTPEQQAVFDDFVRTVSMQFVMQGFHDNPGSWDQAVFADPDFASRTLHTYTLPPVRQRMRIALNGERQADARCTEKWIEDGHLTENYRIMLFKWFILSHPPREMETFFTVMIAPTVHAYVQGGKLMWQEKAVLVAERVRKGVLLDVPAYRELTAIDLDDGEEYL